MKITFQQQKAVLRSERDKEKLDRWMCSPTNLFYLRIFHDRKKWRNEHNLGRKSFAVKRFHELKLVFQIITFNFHAPSSCNLANYPLKTLFNSKIIKTRKIYYDNQQRNGKFCSSWQMTAMWNLPRKTNIWEKLLYTKGTLNEIKFTIMLLKRKAKCSKCKCMLFTGWNLISLTNAIFSLLLSL